MIIQLTGNVTYPITLDPSVWIFDDRKILFEQAFESKDANQENTDKLEKASERFNREIFQHQIKPPVNKSISRFEREKILKNTYVMPIKDFLKNAEIKENATRARIQTTDGDTVINMNQLVDCLLLFARDGKPVSNEGPVYLFYRDGSNMDNPIKGIKKVIVE